MNIVRKNLTAPQVAQWLKDLRAHPYVPESGFLVSAVMRSGDFYFGGVNVENKDHRLSTHAEEACLAALAVTLGKRARVDEIWVMGATCCGKCRQQISGFAHADVRVHYLNEDGSPMSDTTVGGFLPGTFTLSRFAAEKTGARAVTVDAIKPGPLTTAAIFDWLHQVESVDFFSNVPQAAVLRLDNGHYIAGSKIEDEAFLSMTALQSAQAIAVTAFGPAIRVEEAWVLTSATLPLSALQVLMQLALRPGLPVHFFAADGTVRTLALPDAARACAQ